MYNIKSFSGAYYESEMNDWFKKNPKIKNVQVTVQFIEEHYTEDATRISLSYHIAHVLYQI